MRGGALRVGVIGAGALGTVVASRLARCGDTILFVREPADAERVARNGLVVDEEAPVDVTVTADPAEARACDAILIAVKTTATPSLAPFASFVRAGVPLLTLQNGLENEMRLSTVFGTSADVVLGPTMCGGTLVELGRVRAAAIGVTTLGRPADGASAGVASLAPLERRLRDAGLPVALAADVRSAVWAKAVVNGAINGLAALHGVSNGALLESVELRAACAELAREAAAVATALSIVLPFTDPVAHVEDAVRATARNRNSMLQDLEAGRTTEIDALNAAIVRAGERAGVGVAANRDITSRIRACEPDGATRRSSETRGPWPNDA